jgi:hypothetical protein
MSKVFSTPKTIIKESKDKELFCFMTDNSLSQSVKPRQGTITKSGWEVLHSHHIDQLQNLPTFDVWPIKCSTMKKKVSEKQ